MKETCGFHSCVDSWERHLAAIEEARRLLELVLRNNTAFRTWEDNQGFADTGASSAALASDPQFTAYQHLTKALEALRPIPTAGAVAAQPDGPLSARITEIRVPTLASGEPAEPSPIPKQTSVPANEAGDLEDLKARLSYVLEEAPGDLPSVSAGWRPSGDEAQVSIVRPPVRGMPEAAGH